MSRPHPLVIRVPVEILSAILSFRILGRQALSEVDGAVVTAIQLLHNKVKV